MQIPDLDYSRAFGTYNVLRSLLAAPVPFWWAGGSLIAVLRRVLDLHVAPWAADVDIVVRETDYPVLCAHLRARDVERLAESVGDGTIPSRIGQGPSSVWQVPGLSKLDVIALPGGSNGMTAPIHDWLAMMDLNVCQVLVGPGVDGICVHAEGSVLRDIAAGRVRVEAHHPTTEARAEKYRRRLGGG